MAAKGRTTHNYLFDAEAIRSAVGPGFQSGATDKLLKRASRR